MATAQIASPRPVRVDLDNNTGRSDTTTAGWTSWEIQDVPTQQRTIDGVTVSIRADDGNALTGAWYKATLADGATVASDGWKVDSATAGRGAGLEMRLEGLDQGRHSLVTFHNAVDRIPMNKCVVTCSHSNETHELVPSHRSSCDEDMATAYFHFELQAGEVVIIRISCDDGPVVLNGVELESSNPQHRAMEPRPHDRDWHVGADDGTVRLRWKPVASATRYVVYHAANRDLEQARESLYGSLASSAKLGEAQQAAYDFRLSESTRSHPNNVRYHCWRVDAIDDEGNVHRGDVWSFRLRQRAFPTAEGYGRFAIGGRGGRVIKVTTLKDSGPGSLRAAVDAEGPRTVIFDVSGRIELQSRLTIRNPFLTIAGQSAPGKGICISNYNLGMMGTHDVIVRHLRVRPGDTAGKTLDGMGMASSDHAIIDHCSISWSQDEAVSSRGAKNITLQWTLISEALHVAGHKKYEKGKGHSFAASIGGDIGTFHHNLLAHCAGRNWSLAGGLDQANRHRGRLDIVNNVVYNWEYRTTDGGAAQVVFENNYYKPGPATRVWHLIKPEREGVPAYGPQDYFVAGNIMEGKYDQDTDSRAGIIEPKSEPLDGFLYDERFFPSFVDVQSAREALDSVLAEVGCNRPRMDDHDRRVIREVRRGTTTFVGSISGLPGIPDSQADVGGWEEYPEVRRPADWDSDDDGLPDAWERRHGWNPHSPSGDLSDAHADPNGDGYTNLEEYLIELAS